MKRLMIQAQTTEMASGPGMSPLTVESSREEIEDRIPKVGHPQIHALGLCALGMLLNSDLRVISAEQLRVVDVRDSQHSVGRHLHLQATLYEHAERAAAMIYVGKRTILIGQPRFEETKSVNLLS